MSTQLSQERLGAIPLPILASQINSAHRECIAVAQDTIGRAVEVGRLLVEAKSQVKHGEWAAWVEQNCECSLRTCQVYMRVYNHRDQIQGPKAQLPALLSLEGVIAALATSKEAPSMGTVQPRGTVVVSDQQEAPERVVVKPAPVTGQSRVNGQLVDDPPDVAKLRAAGKISAGVVPEIEEPDETTSVDAVREEIEERRAIQEEGMTDQEWVAKLPLSKVLVGVQLATFQEDAMNYRELEPARKTFGWHATRVFNGARRKGEYLWRAKFFLKLDGPERWVRCEDVEMGGCGGSGLFFNAACEKCRGRGYRIN
jgi:hypothetical protein